MGNRVSDGDRTRSPLSHSLKTKTAQWRVTADEKIDRSGGPEACWPWTGRTNADGYGMVSVPGRQDRRIHRLVLAETLGRQLGGDEVVRHSCDNPPCCNPAHLLTGSQALNVADREARGRTASGERLPQSKLTAEKVLLIFKAAPRTVAAQYEFADTFGVSPTIIRDIMAGRRWNAVTGLPKARKVLPGGVRGKVRIRAAARAVIGSYAAVIRARLAVGA